MNIISERRSIRKYKGVTVSRIDIETILNAGILAPSAKNRQSWKYYVYEGAKKDELLACMESGLVRERDEEKLLPNSQNDLLDAFNTLRIMKEAPILIIIENTNGFSPYLEIDADNRVMEICDTLSIGASVQNVLLTATKLGYGTLWIANTCFAYTELVNFVKIRGQLVGAISLGVPDENPNQRPRKKFEDVVEFR